MHAPLPALHSHGPSSGPGEKGPAGHGALSRGPASIPSIFKVHYQCKKEGGSSGGPILRQGCAGRLPPSPASPLPAPNPFRAKTRTLAGSRKGQACVCSVRLCTAARCRPDSGPPRPGPEASARRAAAAPPGRGAGLAAQAAPPRCCCCLPSRSPGCWASPCWNCWLGRRCGRGWETRTTKGPVAAGWQKDAAEAETPGSWVSPRQSPAVCSSALGSGERPHWGQGDGGIPLGLGWGWGFSTFLVKETKGEAFDHGATHAASSPPRRVPVRSG